MKENTWAEMAITCRKMLFIDVNSEIEHHGPKLFYSCCLCDLSTTVSCGSSFPTAFETSVGVGDGVSLLLTNQRLPDSPGSSDFPGARQIETS